jgi:predicted nucleotidyltransferase
MWIPAWAGKVYVRMVAMLGLRPFLLDEAASITGLQRSQMRNLLSILRRRGFMVVYGRKGRKRLYRLLDPSTVLYLKGLGVESYAGLPGPYVPLLLAFLRTLLERLGPRLKSVVLYGSVARETPGPESDIDLILVIEGLPRDYLKRASLIARLEDHPDIRRERKLLREAGRSGRLSYVLMEPEEARTLRLLYLDVSTEGVILLDRDGLMARVLARTREEMERAGAVRHQTDRGWYWTFGRDLRVGEAMA